jgi:serine/threonine-protein kinase RsbW
MRPPADFGVRDEDLTDLVIPSDLRSAKQPEEQIVSQMINHGYDRDTIFALRLALEEAITNAIRHGNRNDPTKHIHLRYHVNPDRVVVMVRDEGRGFRRKAVPDPTADENLQRAGGRGIMLMRCYMTKVRYNRAGNEVWLLKKRKELDR